MGDNYYRYKRKRTIDLKSISITLISTIKLFNFKFFELPRFFFFFIYKFEL